MRVGGGGREKSLIILLSFGLVTHIRKRSEIEKREGVGVAWERERRWQSSRIHRETEPRVA